MNIAVAGIAAAVALAGTAAATDRPADWGSYNRTLAGDRYAPQTSITPKTARHLQRLCSFDLGRQTSFQSGPIVVDNTVYITADAETIAIDATTCAPKWRVAHAYTSGGPPKVNRGAAVADGRVFRGTQDGSVLAYEAATGKPLWEVAIANPALGESIPSALIAWQGLVFAGNSGGDRKGVKGRMYALDAATGKVVWEQYLVPRESGDSSYGPHAPAPVMPAGGWSNATPDVPITGGATWTSYSLDPATGTLYVPAGNPGPDFARQLRPGTNPYAGQLVALDARTGAVKAAYPLVEGDYHDWDVSAAPALLTTRGGTRIAVAAIKNGYMYGIDPRSGRHLWTVQTTTVANADVPFSSTSTHFCPGTQGGTEWNGPGYSPRTNLVYVGAVDWCTSVKLAADDVIKAVEPGHLWSGAEGKPFGEPDPQQQWSGWITAVDADRGTVAWKRQLPGPVLGAVTPTAGGVVFAADMLGNVYVLDARTGATVWQTQTAGAVGGGIVSYAIASGAQRIGVMTGMVSPNWPTAKVNAELIVYGLK